MTTPTREQVVQWAKESGLDLMPGNLHFDWSDRNLSAFTMLARADLEAENVSLNALNENYLAKIRELEAELDKVKGRYAENIAYNKELKAELKAELESLRNGLVIVGYAATNPNGYINLLNVYRKPPINKLQPGIVLIPLYAAAPKEKSEMEELDFKRVGPPRKSFTPAGKLTHAEIVAFKAAIFEAEPEGVEYISNLEAENAALKEELKAINAALDDPRTDLTMTACQVIAALKEQVAQLQVTPADKREDLRCVISDICAQARELQETIAQ